MLTIALVATVLLPRVHAQPFDSAQGKRQEPLPEALTQMIEAERAFAARALVVGWKQAFLDASPTPRSGSTKAGRASARAGGEESGPAQRSAVDLGAALRRRAASGELGYLTGPVKNILPSRNKGQPRHSNYFSVWKREARERSRWSWTWARKHRPVLRHWLHARAARQSLHR